MRPDRPAIGQAFAQQSLATPLALACAGAWAGLMAVLYWTAHAAGPAPLASIIAFCAAALGPIVIILFAGWAARDAARANDRLGDLTALTETAVFAPTPEAIEDARDLAAALRTEMEALDSIVHVTARRLDAFETGLRRDGGVLARALAEDVATLGRARQDLNAETNAVGEAVARHVAALADAAAGVEAHMAAFGAVSARIGARSKEFADAAAGAAGAAGQLDLAVEKALTALAHATSLTDTARKSAEAAANVAQEAAGAVRGATRNAVAEAREAAKRIRAEAGASAPSFSLRSATAKAEPERAPPRSPSGASVTELRRPSTRDLAAIVAESGVRLADTLSTDTLDKIAQAARHGANARREAVRVAAPQAIRKISAQLRRDASARRDAETLRRQPARALGAPTELPTRRRDLASAYLLIDAVLG